ncbi:MAG: dihydropteroate synthase [Sneathiella sp.]|nr:dihydropteroate synthase [Sneathiella sp.]
MTDNIILKNEGSALPRSLRLSDKVYLAPSPNLEEGGVEIALRSQAGDVQFFKSDLAEVIGWGDSLPDHLSSISKQASGLQRFWDSRTEPSQLPKIMGIVNVTPDSFSDGGSYFDPSNAITHAEELVEAGADILDIGGESTRPGADRVEDIEELARVKPVVEGCKSLGKLISIDTRKSVVMEGAIEAGAGLINDVTALDYDPRSLQIAATSNLPVCLMHSSADPKVMQKHTDYRHVLFDVIDYLSDRVETCVAAGITRDRLIPDPGIGFGKVLDQNLALLKGLRYFHALGGDVLLGASRKTFIGKLDREAPATERTTGSVLCAVQGAVSGVQIVRVHDVAETRQGLAVWRAIEKSPLTV